MTDSWNTTGTRAATVFGEALACGYLLGGLGGFVVAQLIGIDVAGINLGYATIAGIYGFGIGAAVGLLIGFLVGAVLGLFVIATERRFGNAAVARAFPVVGLSITLPLAALFGMVGGTLWMLAIVVLDASFTYAGAHLLAVRYLRRSEVAHLH
jgi:hypothetical protein